MKKYDILILILFTFVQCDIFSQAPSCEELRLKWPQYVKDFHINLDSAFSDNWLMDEKGNLIPVFECSSREYVLASTIWYIEHLKFDTIEGIPPNFYEIMKSNKRLFNLFMWGEARDNEIADTDAYNIYLKSDFFALGPVQRAAVLYHEYRHLSDNDQGHRLCKKGMFKGVMDMLCDERLEDEPNKYGSGFNADAYFFYWVAFRQIGNLLDREDAKGRLRFVLFNRFNEIREDQIKRFLHQ